MLFDAPTSPGAGTPGAAILRRQSDRESAARTYARWLDIVPVSASGGWITAADGRRYLDCLAGAGTLALGHNHPEVVHALRRTLERGAPLHMLDVATAEKDEFVSELYSTLPAGFLAQNPKIQFCGPTGADGIEAAIKLCQTATGRTAVASFRGAYHGMTIAALAASGPVAPKARLAPSALDVVRLPYPYALRCPFGGSDADGEMAARYIERLFEDPSGGSTLPALILVEPVQGEGGVVPGPLPWMRRLAQAAKRHGVPLVVDEVQAGVGRTGSFWAYEQAGIVPDAMVVSKAIGGGLPLSAVLYRDGLDTWEAGAHAGTFRGNVLAMVAGATTLGIVRRDELPARAGLLGERIVGDLSTALAGDPRVAEVRGRGLMIGVELTDPREPQTPAGLPAANGALARVVRAACLRRGLIIEVGGHHDSVLRLLPPLTMSDAEANLAIEILLESLHETDNDGSAA